jgi:hypothetical protein
MSFWLSFLVPFALYLQQLGTRTSHFAWYLLHFGWSLCILHGTCYIWPCSPSILHGACHILAFQPFMRMVFATFLYFKRSCGSLESSLGFHLGRHLRFYLGFQFGFHLGSRLKFL